VPAGAGGIQEHPEVRLGLTDLAKPSQARTMCSPRKHFDRNGLRTKVLRYRPRILAFHEQGAAAEEFIGHPVDYGLMGETIGETALFVLPSPSGAARRYWDPKHWRELARLRGDAEPPVMRHRSRSRFKPGALEVAMDTPYISRDPEIMSGAPCFKGTRVLVQNLFDYLEGSSSLEDFLEDFPSVSREAAIAVLETAKARLFCRCACC